MDDHGCHTARSTRRLSFHSSNKPLEKEESRTFVHLAVVVLGLAHEHGRQHGQDRRQQGLLLVDDDGRVVGLAQVTAHDVTEQAPGLLANLHRQHCGAQGGGASQFISRTAELLNK